MGIKRKIKNYLEVRNYSDSFKFNATNEKVYENSILILDQYILTPDKDSGSNRLFQIIKFYCENNIKVFYPVFRTGTPKLKIK